MKRTIWVFLGWGAAGKLAFWRESKHLSGKVSYELYNALTWRWELEQEVGDALFSRPANDATIARFSVPARAFKAYIQKVAESWREKGFWVPSESRLFGGLR